MPIQLSRIETPMFKRKLLSQVMTAVLASSVLMGCDSSDSDSNDTDGNGSAETATYKMTLSAPEMGAVEGKTTFKLTVTDADDVAVVDTTPKMMPLMTMISNHQHSSPHTGCTPTNDQGVSDCTVYFLMGSGPTMGTWDLTFTVGMGDEAESKVFQPSVMMAMGDTKKAQLKGGAGDQIPGMMANMPEARSYYIFNNGLSGMTGNHSIELYIAAKESGMSYPALALNTELKDGENTPLTPTTIAVKVSADKDAVDADWVTAVSAGAGIYTASNLTGLTNNSSGKLYVKLSVNGEDKTTDGNGVGANFAEFNVTPGGAMEMPAMEEAAAAEEGGMAMAM